MTLLDQIRQDMTAAMKAREAVKLRTLRSVIAACQIAQSETANSKELDDTQVQKIISNQVKKRLEAAEAFQSGGAEDRAKSELEEKEVLDSYLPKQMSETELEDLVNQILDDNNFKEKSDMSSAMKLINSEVAGRADGKKIAEIVKSKLQ